MPKKSNIMFVRGENQSQSVLEAEKEPTVNPDAIDLDSDDDSDEVRNFNQWTLKKPRGGGCASLPPLRPLQPLCSYSLAFA